jgi:histidinol dehydrogenase
MDLADAEGLDAHRNAVKIRLTGLDLPSVLTQADEDNTAIDSASKQTETSSGNNVSTDDRVYIDTLSGKQQ